MVCNFLDGEPSEEEQQIAELTRMLCAFCETAEKAGMQNLMTPAIQKWWSAHRVADAKRNLAKSEAKTPEELVRAVLAELTDDERAALKAQGLEIK